MSFKFSPAAPSPAPAPVAPAPAHHGMASIFAGLNPATIREKAPYLNSKAGTYWVLLEVVKTGMAQRTGVAFFAIEGTVMKTLAPSPVGDSFTEGTPVGVTAMKNSDYFVNDVGAFAWGILSANFKEQGYQTLQQVPPAVLQQAMDWMTGPEQPLTNTVVEVHNYERAYTPKKGPNAGKLVKINCTDWRGVVSKETLAAGLSAEARSALPANFFA